jgi:hypothetical protein
MSHLASSGGGGGSSVVRVPGERQKKARPEFRAGYQAFKPA